MFIDGTTYFRDLHSPGLLNTKTLRRMTLQVA